MKKLLLLAQRSWVEYGADNCSQMAAAISYRTLTAIVPLTMFAVAVIGLIAGSQDVQNNIAEQIQDYLRLDQGDVIFELTDGAGDSIEARYGAAAVEEIEAELTDLNESDERQDERRELADDLDAGESVTIAGYELTADEVVTRADNLVAQTLRSVVEASGAITIVSFAAFAYTASGWVGAIRRSLDFVWDVRTRRPMVVGKLVDLGGLFVLALLLVAFIAAAALLRTLQEMGSGWLDFVPVAHTIISAGVTISVPWAIALLFCLMAYRYGPSVKNQFGDVWLGAILAATGMLVLVHGYGFYIANFGSFNAIYGALGGVLLFMLVVNLAAQAFLFGAEVSAEYPRVMAGLYAEVAAGEPQANRSLRQMAIDAVRSLFVRKPD